MAKGKLVIKIDTRAWREGWQKKIDAFRDLLLELEIEYVSDIYYGYDIADVVTHSERMN